ncbi:MAG: MFS transporter [Acidimicrobiia bacterium]|nr:MFS transporter [Acidimicrobiia bacterium]
MTDIVPRSGVSMIVSGPFARYWWASLVSSTGDWITLFATIALGNAIGGEVGVLLALLSRIVPGLIVGPVVGVLTDRFDRRKLVVIADVGRGLLVPALLFATNLPVLAAVNFGLEMLSLLGQAPRNAMVPRLVGAEGLVTANSLILGSTFGTIPLGAGFSWALASLPLVTFGGLIPDATAGLTFAFAFDAATFFVSAALIWSLPATRTRVVSAAAKVASPKARDDFVEGIRFFWSRRSVRRVIVGMTSALMGGGLMIVVGSPFVTRVLAADDTGFFAIITMAGLGAAAAVTWLTLFGTRLLRRDLVFAFSLLATGGGLTATAFTSTVFGAASWMAVFGFGAGAAYVMGFTHIQEQVNDEMRGRVFATLFTLMRMGLFVAMALAPSLDLILDQSGIGPLGTPKRGVLVVGGLLIAASGGATLWSLRDSFGRPHFGPEARDIIAEAVKARGGNVGSSEEADDGDQP